MLKFGYGLLVVQEVLSFNILLDEDAFNSENHFLNQALVYKFNGDWPRVSDLHKCTSEAWKPFFMHEMNIYPMA